ncbi:hypothetical protein ACFL27_01640 [candidate division CSSED10-310 bacterium]|uniref:Glycosyltransferase RgtA/B/C/D-like domain-containing protein n=1 Tax=candidate division CSSED10-310 bacterium TaxID=2855610 RepID=A0ABV6YRQ6_UNCC1
MLEKLIIVVNLIVYLALFCLFFIDIWEFSVDDSFIFFRYAENIARGFGVVFNHGETPGEGFTSWAWVGLLSIICLSGFELIVTSKCLGFLFFLFSAGLVFVIIAELNSWSSTGKITAFILAGGVLLNYPLLAHSVSGMETSLFIFSFTGLIYVTTRAWNGQEHDDKYWLLLSLSTFFLFLVRPEGIVAGGISYLTLGIRHQGAWRKPRVYLFIMSGLIIPLALFLLWKLVYFGHILPLTFYHKVVSGEREYEWTFRLFFRFVGAYGWLIFPVLLLSYHTLYSHRKKIFWYYYILFIVMIGFYLFFVPVMNYLNRFYMPYLVVLVILLSPAVSSLVGTILNLKNGISRLVLILLIFFLMVTGMNLNIHRDRRSVENWKMMVTPERYRGKLGRVMSFLPSTVVVANTEMGVIPYYSGLTCLDMAGLTDPIIAHQGLTMNYLSSRNTDLILFARDVRKIPAQEFQTNYFPYGKIFLAPAFKHDYEFLGSFVAWADKKSRYYFFVNKNSAKNSDIRQWYQKYVKL